MWGQLALIELLTEQEHLGVDHLKEVLRPELGQSRLDYLQDREVVGGEAEFGLDLVQGEGLAIELRSLPKITRSGGFSLAFLLADGGEANIVIGTSGSMFGSIKPLSGDVHHVLESCGDNCSVLMERPSDFFNQFED